MVYLDCIMDTLIVVYHEGSHMAVGEVVVKATAFFICANLR